jgi:hypothetical protein
MRLRVEELSLAGSNRQLNFQPGLNLISGPIATGKTTSVRLIRMLLGDRIGGLPREVKDHVGAIEGRIVIGEDRYSVVRALVGTPTARVEIAGPGVALRLPAHQPDAEAPYTYGDWLLDRLGLPRLDVPSAPTRPDSPPTPVSINDFMSYCSLTEDQIGNSVFGHTDTFRNIKRRYVFQILYGIYDVRAAGLQEELRALSGRHSELVRVRETLALVLRDTPWENRAELSQAIAEAETAVAIAERAEVTTAVDASPASRVQRLQEEIGRLDTQAGKWRTEIEREAAAAEQLRRLIAQLETQSARLTRAMVADTRLLDFEFVLCPRCGTSLSADRGSSDTCLLCLQVPERSDNHKLLADEQSRLAGQLNETRGLVASHESASAARRVELERLTSRRAELGAELDHETRAFVSDSRERIADQATARTRERERLIRLRDYATLFTRFDAALAEQSEIASRLAALEEEIGRLTSRGSEAEARIHVLEEHLEAIVDRFGVPRYADPPSVRIDRTSFLPVLDGRAFETLSQGMKVLLNVAHLMAHHLTALELNLPLPGFAIIDGVSSSLGREGYDEAVRQRVYEYLIEVSNSHGPDLQMLVTDNDVPRYAHDFVRLELERDNLLVI